MAFSPLCLFAPWTIRPLACSPIGPGSRPVHGLSAVVRWTIRPRNLCFMACMFFLHLLKNKLYKNTRLVTDRKNKRTAQIPEKLVISSEAL